MAAYLQKCEEFLRGAHDIDVHWRDAPFQENIPVLMGLIRWAGKRIYRPDGPDQVG